MYICNLKICNFRSFVGENQVVLKPYSAVMFSNDQGKNDFCAALHFLLGRDLSDLGFDCVEKLYHPIFSGDSAYPDLVVSALFDVRSRSSGSAIEISRIVRNRTVVYLVDQRHVSIEEYQKLIRGMCCENPILFTFSDFIKAMWDADGIETVISEFARIDLKYNEIKKAQRRLNISEIALKMQSEKHSLAMVRDQANVDKVLDEYQNNILDQESRRQSVILDLSNMMQRNEEIDSVTPTESSSMEMESSPLEQKFQDSYSFYEEEDTVMNGLLELMLQEAELLGVIDYHETKLANEEADISFFQGKKIRRYEIECRRTQIESHINEIWMEISANIEEISRELADIEYVRQRGPPCLSRLTAYGRLIDWLKPGQYLWMFRAVLGESLLYGHLIDDRDEAEKFIACLKDRCVASRETFIIFSDYSPKLKETLFEGGEKGLPIKNQTDVLTLLSKFNEFGLISNVPAVVCRGGLRLEPLGEDDEVIFTSTGEYTSEGGIFGRHVMNDSKAVDLPEILKSVNHQLVEQENLFGRLYELHIELYKCRFDIEACNETRMQRKRAGPQITPGRTAVHIPDIYGEYGQLFEDYEKTLDDELLSFENLNPIRVTNSNETKNILNIIKADLANVERLKKEKEEELCSAAKRLNRKFLNALQETLVVGNAYVLPQPEKDKSVLTLASRMNEIHKIIKDNELEELKGGMKWRKMVLENLHTELKETKKEHNASLKNINILSNARYEQLRPFIQFCNDSMPIFLQDIFGTSAGCELKIEDGETLRMFIGFNNTGWQDIMESSMFVRCVALLVLFLHTACFRGGILVLIDDLSEFFPRNDKDAECIIGEDNVTRFDIVTRVGEAVSAFLTQIRGFSGDSPRNERLMNLDQVLLLTSDDLAVSTDAQVIIVQDVVENHAHSFPFISTMMNI